MMSGCFMAPLALIGPATSGFSTASIIQSGLTTGANYLVKQSTGKTMGEHAYDAISSEILEQAYFPTIEYKKSSLRGKPYKTFSPFKK